MDASEITAARRGGLNRPLVFVALVACAWIGLSAGDANAGLSPGQSCAAKKLKEAAKVVGTMLKCVTPPGPPVDQGAPPGPCIQAAGARLAETFSKIEAKGGCIDTNDATAIQANIESLVRKLSVAIPSDPPCAVVGQACGSCGSGLCQPAFPGGAENRKVCVDLSHCGSVPPVCASDADCPKGDACLALPSPLPPVCCPVCPGCNDNDDCTQDLEVGQLCAHTPAPDGTSCGDGNLCDGVGVCESGACTLIGIGLNCNDGNPCTLDVCEPLAGCVHNTEPSSTACDDGNACTLNDHCSNSVCFSTDLRFCNDQNPCTKDFCDPKSGCVFDPTPENGQPCNGGNGTCQNGTCK